jgi:hypothetical protein
MLKMSAMMRAQEVRRPDRFAAGHFASGMIVAPFLPNSSAYSPNRGTRSVPSGEHRQAISMMLSAAARTDQPTFGTGGAASFDDDGRGGNGLTGLLGDGPGDGAGPGGAGPGTGTTIGSGGHNCGKSRGNMSA